MPTWYLHTADAADRLLAPMRARVPLDQTAVKPLELADYDGALAWCEAEYPNLMAAVQTAAEAGEDAIAWKLAVALTCYLEICRPWASWVTVAQTALTAAQRAGDPRGEAWLLNQLGHPYAVLGRFDEALDCLQRALYIRRETGERRAEGSTVNNIGMIYGELGRFEDSIRYFQNALDIAVETGDHGTQSVATRRSPGTRTAPSARDLTATHQSQADKRRPVLRQSGNPTLPA